MEIQETLDSQVVEDIHPDEVDLKEEDPQDHWGGGPPGPPGNQGPQVHLDHKDTEDLLAHWDPKDL